MSALLLYEISGDPKGSYLNAIEILSLDPYRELFLSDILHYFARTPMGCCFMFYVLVGNRLVWLDSPTSLVPVGPDGIIRMVLKPATIPPFIHIKQNFDFADKSRIQFYSRHNYEKTSEFAYRTFYETGKVVSQMIRQRDQARKQGRAQSTAQPTFEWRSGPDAAQAYVGSAEVHNQFDNFADFDNNFAASNGHRDRAEPYRDETFREREPSGRPPLPGRYSDHPDYNGDDGAPKRYAEQRRLPSNKPNSSRYNHDHPKGGKDKDGDGNNLNAYVGEDTAAVVNEAVEAVGTAAKNFFSFATTLSKSVFEMAQAGAAQGAAAVTSSGSVGKLYPGAVVQVGRMAVSVVRELAEGGFGIVYVVEDCTRGNKYALKQLLCQSREQVNEAHNELDTLRRFQGRSDGNIIELLEFTAAGDGRGGSNGASNMTRQVLMLFPLYPAGTLWDHIADASAPHVHTWPFPEPTALYLVMCAAEALLVLHREGLAHRDVKPHNFLLEQIPEKVQASRGIPSPFRPVLMDLGSVTTARVQVKTKRDALNLEEEAASKTSAAYRSPELTSAPFPPFQVDERVDTWGLGCTMYCIAFGRSPFETPKEGVLRLAILNGKYSVPPGNRHKDCVYSEGFMRLIERMLRVDIGERPYVEEVIRTCQDLLSKFE